MARFSPGFLRGSRARTARFRCERRGRACGLIHSICVAETPPGLPCALPAPNAHQGSSRSTRRPVGRRAACGPAEHPGPCAAASGPRFRQVQQEVSRPSFAAWSEIAPGMLASCRLRAAQSVRATRFRGPFRIRFPRCSRVKPSSAPRSRMTCNDRQRLDKRAEQAYGAKPCSQ
jgi:hypothetical protein